MSDYRRNFIAGGTYFFTVNLEDRSLHLLTENIERLRDAFRYTRARRPFAIDAMVVLPDHLHAIWTLARGRRGLFDAVDVDQVWLLAQPRKDGDSIGKSPPKTRTQSLATPFLGAHNPR